MHRWRIPPGTSGEKMFPRLLGQTQTMLTNCNTPADLQLGQKPGKE
ncbi:hypothetical protein NW851_12365 [Synechococcus sp. H55.7]